MSAHQTARIPSPGQFVRLRTRTYVVEAVASEHGDPFLTRVSAACLDDDAQGEALDVVWGLEADTEILDQEAWKTLGEKGFDEPRFFGAYWHTLRWNCVTATDPRLFQSPFRAGIRIDAYQLEPLRKALQKAARPRIVEFPPFDRVGRRALARFRNHGSSGARYSTHPKVRVTAFFQPA